MVELFAGVGGFRLGLEKAGWQTIWANQWEPTTKAQHAADCYIHNFGDAELVVEDIAQVVAQIPEHDLLVGGFPCQDYSVAKTLSDAHGLNGARGRLWWTIQSILAVRRPRFVFLENVDRLLKSPASHRGRDFALILESLSDLGYLVEWRVVSADAYGFPQKRRRVYIVAEQVATPSWSTPDAWLLAEGVLASALPAKGRDQSVTVVDVDSIAAGGSQPRQRFLDGGVMWKGSAWTRRLDARFRGRTRTLEEVLVPIDSVPDQFFVPPSQVGAWSELKAAKKIRRTTREGYEYVYAEGAIPFPDPVGRPARTILTGEGGPTPSRFKHVIFEENRRYRRLTPIELERLNGFPDAWTDSGMSDGRRAFMMGNALIVGLVQRIGRTIAEKNMSREDSVSVA
ncbi:MAG: DNA cytosine methyltransferase [Actinomycetota bacterium]